MNDKENNDDPYKFYFQIDTEWIKKYMDSLLNKIDYQWIDKEVLEEIIDKNIIKIQIKNNNGEK